MPAELTRALRPARRRARCSHRISGLGALADASADANPPADALWGRCPAGDLAYVRLLIGVELLTIDFYTHAIGSKHLRAGTLDDAGVALINESEHYTYLAARRSPAPAARR